MLEASNSIKEAISLHLSIRHRVEQWAGKGISSKEGTYIAHDLSGRLILAAKGEATPLAPPHLPLASTFYLSTASIMNAEGPGALPP